MWIQKFTTGLCSQQKTHSTFKLPIDVKKKKRSVKVKPIAMHACNRCCTIVIVEYFSILEIRLYSLKRHGVSLENIFSCTMTSLIKINFQQAICFCKRCSPYNCFKRRHRESFNSNSSVFYTSILKLQYFNQNK